VRANRRVRPGGFTGVICQHLLDDVYPQPRSDHGRSTSAAARNLGLLDRDLPALLWLGCERRSDGSRSDDVESDRRAFGRWGTRAGSGVDNEVDSRAVNANPLHLGLEAGFAHHLPSRG
jgi:hypothetical protein